MPTDLGPTLKTRDFFHLIIMSSVQHNQEPQGCSLLDAGLLLGNDISNQRGLIRYAISRRKIASNTKSLLQDPTSQPYQNPVTRFNQKFFEAFRKGMEAHSADLWIPYINSQSKTDDGHTIPQMLGADAAGARQPIGLAKVLGNFDFVPHRPPAASAHFVLMVLMALRPSRAPPGPRGHRV